ncbi:hypothetical protein [Mycolicibacterium sp. P9-22]|uniref:hypothetical protein n=1 Tax=Mycolicibacterium sp. P9-22 TaxID=2024613 RepID=UPI0011ED6BFD|nr:hypothetical protein [Mycolicibacterium sp. P9-22]
MQILASALPGFRDLRAPLTAGYLWLLLLWILIRPNLATRPSNDITAALWDLGKAAGPLWIALGVSVAAYLIGSVNQFAANVIKHGFEKFSNRKVKPRWFSYTDNDELVRLVESPHPIDSMTREASLKLLRAGMHPENDEAEIKSIELNINQRAIRARDGLRAELAMPATLLLGDKTELFAEADRLKAESELRLAAASPLTAIAIFLSFCDVWWWAVALIPIAMLAAQGYDRHKDFQALMEASVIRGEIRSESLEAFRMWVSNLPPDGKPPTAARD